MNRRVQLALAGLGAVVVCIATAGISRAAPTIGSMVRAGGLAIGATGTPDPNTGGVSRAAPRRPGGVRPAAGTRRR